MILCHQATQVRDHDTLFFVTLQGVCVSMLTKRGGLIQSVEQSEDWFTGMVTKFYFYFGYYVTSKS